MADLIEVTGAEGPVAEVRLARPEKKNAVTLEMLDALTAAGEALAAARGLRAVVGLPPCSAAPLRSCAPRWVDRRFLFIDIVADVLECTRCKGPMKVLVCLEKPDAVRKILRHLGLRDTPLQPARSRGPPQPDFSWEM